MTTTHRSSGPLADLVRHLDGDTLRQLAASADSLHHRHFTDPERAAQEYADIVAKGGRPTLGWWRRHLAPVEPVTPPLDQPARPRLCLACGQPCKGFVDANPPETL